MCRARIVVWSTVTVMVLCSLWLARARSEGLREAGQALDRAQLLLEKGSPDHAAAILTRLVREQPRCAEAHALLAQARSAQGFEAQALEHYRVVADLRPQQAEPYYDLAACCVAIHRYDIAERYLSRRLRDAPHDAYARRLLTLVRERGCQFEKARVQQKPGRTLG